MSGKEFIEVTLNDLFEIKGGTAGLTAEVIYNNQPTEDDGIPVYSGAVNVENAMGFISKNTKINGNPIKVYDSPSIVVSRKGKAGTMSIINKGQYCTNEAAYALIVRDDFKDKINFKWFINQYQELFYNLVTSKSDNGTFSKKYAERQTIIIPPISVQGNMVENIEKLEIILSKLESLKEKIENLLDCKLRE